MTDDEIYAAGAAAVADGLRSGRLDAEATTSHYLQRIARCQPRLNAYTQLDAAGARAAARESAARLAAGMARPLEGVPIAVKANIAVAGLPTHAGIAARAGDVAAQDAEVVRRLRAAGAVILGITNMHEGAFGAITDNPHFGATHNPWRHGYTPGGSSGGSGAAVAAGLCAAALGTDTFGSVRIPASWCGITALKPTYGLVPDSDVVPLVAEFDCVGPMAVRVADCALLLRAMAAPADSADIAHVALAEFTAGPDLHPAVAAARRTAAALLRGLGVDVREQRFDVDFADLRRAVFLSGAVGAAEANAQLLRTHPEGFSEEFRSRASYGATSRAAARAQAQARLQQTASELRAALQVVEAVLLPTTPQPAFAFSTRAPQTLADFTALASISGLPALALPAGWTADGLPVGVQLVGRAGRELALLRLGARLEKSLNAWRFPADCC